MPNFLIYKDRGDFFGQREHIIQLQGRFDSSDFCDQNIDLLKEKITKDKIRILLILTKERISEQLERFLEKSRNHINLHDALIIIVHTKWSARDAQLSLMNGASYILEEPLDLNYLSAIVRNHLSGQEFDLKIGYQHFKSPLECQIDSFGRIGRIEKNSAGNLFVETSLDWQVGASIDLHHLLSLDLKQDLLRYRILDKNSKGLYYRYAYQYHLEWQKNEALETLYRNWLGSHQKQFSIPKVKLLFVVGDGRTGTPVTFGTDLYSSYLIYSNQLSPALLDRIDPQIIIRERLPVLPNQLLEDWLSGSISKKLLLTESDVLAVEKARLDPLRDRLLKEIIPYTRSNFLAVHEQFLYLSRKSEYSRFAFSTQAEIVALSKHHLLLHSTTHFAVGATLQLFLPNDSSLIFLRVLHTEQPTSGGKYGIHCSIFYLSEEQRQALLKEKVWLHSQTKKNTEDKAYLPVQKRVGFLDRHQKLPILLLVTAAILVIALMIFISQGLSNKTLSPGTENNEKEATKSNIDAFQDSVRKAFGLSD